jgi:hypothetical protein
MKNLIKSCFRKPCKQSNISVTKVKFSLAHQLLNNPHDYRTLIFNSHYVYLGYLHLH